MQIGFYAANVHRIPMWKKYLRSFQDNGGNWPDRGFFLFYQETEHCRVHQTKISVSGLPSELVYAIFPQNVWQQISPPPY
jgi:hypothetical protein